MSKTASFSDTCFLSLQLGPTPTPVRAGERLLDPVDLGPEGGGWHVVLPGSLWRDATTDIKLKIGGGLLKRSLTLTRAMLTERLQRLASTPIAELPVPALVTAIEHLHHAQGLFASLDASLQRHLAEGASSVGLLGALGPDAAALLTPDAAPDPARAITPILAAFGAAHRQTPNPDAPALLRDALAGRDLTPEQTRALALDLTPHFCQHDDPATLYQLLLDGDLSRIAPDPDQPWHRSHALPGRLLAGDTAAIGDTLDQLAHDTAWVSTPAIAWTIRALTEAHGPLSHSDRLGLIDKALRFYEAQSARYYAPLPCTELRRSIVALLTRRDRFPHALRADLTWTALKCYGASPSFLRAVDGADLPLELAAAKLCLPDLDAPDPATRDRALAGLRRLGVAATDQIRRDLLGPFGTAETAPTAAHVLLDNGDHPDAILRGLAHPTAPPLDGPDDATLQDAMERAAFHTPKIPADAVWATPRPGDTLVVIRCTPADAPRAFLDQLDRHGIPWRLASGPDSAETADTLSLSEPPDSPAFLLALLDRLRRETDFAHVTLLDAHTRLAIPAFFDAGTYRSADYYGQLATAWEKDGRRLPADPAGRFDILPRDLTHVDARLGITLSRTALDALARAQARPEGVLLARGGHAPDQALAALLALEGIWPRGHGFFGALFEPTEPGTPPVPRTVTGFAIPPRPNGTLTQAMHGTPPVTPARRLSPPMIWANHAPVRLGHFSNALTLVGAPDGLTQKPAVTVICVLRNERFILPHFLAHYRGLGVTRFLIADNGSDDGSVSYLLAQPDVVLFSAETEFRHAMQGTDWKIALMQHFCQDAWALVADADEFLVYPGHETRSLADYLARYDGTPVDAVRVLMLDMYPEGPLSEARFESGTPFDEAGFADRHAFLHNALGLGPYSDAPTTTSGLRHRLMPGSRPELFVSQKVPLFRYKPWMRFSVSLHYAAETTLAPDDLLFAHFKYHADFRAKAEREVRRGQYFNNAEEYRKYLALTAEGQDQLHDPALSVPWREVAEARTILETKN